MSGASALRWPVVTARARSFASFDLGHHRHRRHAGKLNIALQHSQDRQRRRGVKDVHRIGVGLSLSNSTPRCDKLPTPIEA